MPASSLPWPERCAELASSVNEPGFTALAVAAVAAQPDPERTTNDIMRFIAAGPSAAAQVRDLCADPLALRLLADLSTHSRYGLEMVWRWPHRFWAVVQSRRFRMILGRERIAAELAEAQVPFTTAEARLGALIRCQRDHHLRIMLGDLAGLLPLGAVTLELSDLTDGLVQAVLDLVATGLDWMPTAGFTVLAFGKLGGREINYSSDIDLVYVYADSDEPGRHARCCRLAGELTRRLDEHHPDGRLFRVDLRLRPQGGAGELALSRRETIDYYYNVGRAWERQALIKARPVAGDQGLGVGLLDELRPWIYPVDHDWSDLKAARVMRARIEERSVGEDLKTGEGGIRDIEFLVQSLQLGYGGRIESLRERSTLKALQVLGRERLISPFEAAELEGHYRFLRMVEHRLQMYENRQLHALPSEPARLAHLAVRCGFSGPEPFRQELDQVRERVRLLASRHFLDGSDERDAWQALVGSATVDAQLAGRLLGRHGLRDPQKAAAWLQAMAEEPFFVLSRGRTIRNLVRLLPGLMVRVAASPDPDRTLGCFHRVVQAVGGRAAFFDLLAQDANLLDLFVNLAGWAGCAVDLLARHQGLADDLAERGWGFPPGRDLADEARRLVAGLADPAEPLAYLQARELVAATARDLGGAPLPEATARLTDLARALIQVLWDCATAQGSQRWSAPLQPDGQPGRAAVLALGKLGGGEMTYFSDADLLFVHDGGQAADGLEATVFWTRVAQTAMGWARAGRLFEIDARLRPWGEQGGLLVSLACLTDYWQQPRDLWERLAMLRVAPLAGDAGLGAQAVHLIRTAAINAALPPDASTQLRTMRDRLAASVAGRDHVKRGPGGYVDIEFLAQFACLGRPGALTEALPVQGMLHRLGGLGFLPEAAVTECSEALEVLRRMESRIRLFEGRTTSSLPTNAVERLHFARACGYPGLAELDQDLGQARAKARSWFDRLIR